jgi:hypothetical protein
MRDEWRRMGRRDLLSVLEKERAALTKLRSMESAAAGSTEHFHAHNIDQISDELSRRQITLYTAVAAVTGAIAAVAGIAALFR